jgi:hypothetical protein
MHPPTAIELDMDFEPLPFRSPLAAYELQATDLLNGHRAGDPAAIEVFHGKHPRFLDEKIPRRRKFIPGSEIRTATLTIDDARLALARDYGFRDWPALAARVAQMAREGPIHEFEAAVEAVVNGDLTELEASLHRNSTLVNARSSRICNLAPPVHRCTLLHYVAANGIEAYRQKTPPNAVAIARALLNPGAEPDAEADLYGGGATTMGLLVSSDHPARVGLMTLLVELLLDFGAAIEGRDAQKCGGPLFMALAFGKIDAARVLIGCPRALYNRTADGLTVTGESGWVPWPAPSPYEDTTPGYGVVADEPIAPLPRWIVRRVTMAAPAARAPISFRPPRRGLDV